MASLLYKSSGSLLRQRFREELSSSSSKGSRYLTSACSFSVCSVSRAAVTRSRTRPLHHFSSRYLSSSPKVPPKIDTATTTQSSFWTSFLGPKPMPPRYTFAWYCEMALICTVFGITGTSSMMIVRPAVKDIIQIDGNFRDGPWSYRICSIILISPIYASLLVLVGTVFGRHAYFRHFSVKIFRRFGVPPELLDKNWKANQKNFVKW